MSSYIRFPLALLRNSSSAESFFNEAMDFCAVNAGIAFRAKHDEAEWEVAVEKLELTKHQEKNHYLEALVGRHIVGIVGGDQTGQMMRQVHQRICVSCAGSPLVNLDSEKFRNAIFTTRYEAGVGDPPDRPISWREFRVIVAVYSLQWKREGFCIAGWESIRNRSCGFHRKEDYQGFQDSPETVWPDQCLPLTRYQVTSTLDRLEALGFFIRHRISKGDRGGLTAYSIKHEIREKLASDCEQWQAWNQGETIRENRSEDHLLHSKKVSERQKRIQKTHFQAVSILETCKPLDKPSPLEADSILLNGKKQTVEQPKDSKPASNLQVTSKSPASMAASHLQGTLQHNKKCSSKKCSDEKDKDQKYSNSGEVVDGSWEVSVFEVQAEIEESGHLFEGKFLTTQDATAIMIQHPEAFRLFKAAKRITSPDGTIRIEEAA